MRKLFILFFMFGCQTIPTVKDLPKPTVKAKYQVGQCFYLWNNETNKGRIYDALRIESDTGTHYIYRWWTLLEEWAIDTNKRPYKFIEDMTRPVKCPGKKSTNGTL